jgi:hypothetical protein
MIHGKVQNLHIKRRKPKKVVESRDKCREELHATRLHAKLLRCAVQLQKLQHLWTFTKALFLSQFHV